MRKLLVIISVALVAVVGAGGVWLGSRLPKPTDGVAVIDLDAVAQQLGADAAMQNQLKEQQASLNQQLQSMQQSFRQQYQQKSTELKTQPTRDGGPEVEKQLAEIERGLNLELARAQQIAQNKFNTSRTELLQAFRNRVIPVAREVASQRGLQIVITKNDTILLAFSQTHDITDAVTTELRKTYSSQTAPASSTAARPDPTASERR